MKNTSRCTYCKRMFVLLDHHRADKLLPYCSAGCKASALLSEPAAYSTRAWSYADKKPFNLDTLPATATPPHDADPDNDLSDLRFDVMTFLASADPVKREIVLQKAITTPSAKICEILKNVYSFDADAMYITNAFKVIRKRERWIDEYFVGIRRKRKNVISV